MNRLIIVEDKRQAQIATEFINKKDYYGNVILCLSREAEHILRVHHIQYKRESDYINSKDLENIINDAWIKTNSWFKSSLEVERELDFHGVNLGSVYSLQLLKYFSWFNKLNVLVNKIIEKESVNSFVVLEPEFRKLTRNSLKPSEEDILANRLLLDMSLIRDDINVEKVTYPDPAFLKLSGVSIRGLVKSVCKKFIYFVYSFRLIGDRHCKGQTYMFFAGLDYVKDIILSLRKKGVDGIVLVDSSVQLRSLRFCIEHNIRYCILTLPIKLSSSRLSPEVFNAFCTIVGNKFSNSLQERCLLLSTRIGSIKDYVLMIESFLDKLKSDMIILDQDLDEVKKTFTIVARKRGIKTTVISHGIPPRHYAIASTPLTADSLIVGGRVTKEIYVEQGVAADRIHVMGDPRYERVPFIMNKDRESLVKELGFSCNIKEDTRVILFALTNLSLKPSTKVGWYSEEKIISKFYESIEYVLECLSRLKNTFVIIKTHQRTNAENMKRLQGLITVSKLKDKHCAFLSQSDTLKLIKISDIVLSHWSNVCMESVFLRKPTIVIDFVGRNDAYDIIKEGPAIKVNNYQSLKDAVDKILNNKHDGEFLNQCDKVVQEYANNLIPGVNDRIANFAISN